ncbi:MAG: ATP-binding protein [Bacillota bacterium]
MGTLIEKKEFKIKYEAESIPLFIENLFEILNSYNIKIDNFDFRIELTAREMLANAIEHGFVSRDEETLNEEKIKIILKIKEELIIFSVKDKGLGFDWKNCDLEMKPCFDEKGRGLKMIKEVSDDLEFNKKGNKITAFFRADEKITKK